MLPWEPRIVGSQERSADGDCETLIQRTDVIVSVGWEMLVASGAPDTETKRKLRQLSQWIQAGNAFTFARDQSKTVNTTLANAASAGASSVVVTSATGISIGDEYVIRDTVHAENIKVSNVVSTTITLAETLNFGYAAGSRFRYVEFWPAICMPGARLIEDLPPLHFRAFLDFIEDVSGL